MNCLKIILKPLVIICTFILPVLLFFMLLRLANGNTAFFGLNDFVGWIEQQDFYNPIEEFMNFVNSHNTAMRENVNAVLSSTGNIFDMIAAIFRLVGVVAGYLAYPVVFLYHLIAMFIQYVIMFINLIKYVIELRA